MSSDTILTAAHCFDQDDVEKVVAVVGDHDLRKTEGYEQESPILDLMIHPDYDPKSYDNDFAIVKLAAPIQFTEYVGTICLPSVERNFDNVTAKVSGWGHMYDGVLLSDVLQQVKKFKVIFFSFNLDPRFQFKL